MKECLFYTKNGETRCLLCPHRCRIAEGQCGLCSARHNIGGVLCAENYGLISSMALDRIEKKPFARFFPGSRILSIGSYGCSMRCTFCQNFSISQETSRLNLSAKFVSPENLLEKALSILDNLGVAFTYNEPLINIEYILDAAPLLKQAGLKLVLVTNGMILPEPLDALLPFVDAMNIDLKFFSHVLYKEQGGDFETVKRVIRTCAFACHLEVTMLAIPNVNDSEPAVAALSEWLASVSPDIPLHITRFFPRYKMALANPTPPETVFALADIARRNLRYVYEGNVFGGESKSMIMKGR